MKNNSILSLLLLFYLCNTTFSSAQEKSIEVQNGVVVSTSYYASQVGKSILEQGGNAIDASIATAFALSVVWPAAGNIGGGGFLVYYDKNGKCTTIDFREKAPLLSDKKMFLNSDGKIKENSNHSGILSVGVPGTVAGLYLAHKKYGKLEWVKLLEPAINLAKYGILVTNGIANGLDNYWERKFSAYEATKKVFSPDGLSPYKKGDLWIQKDLAETLMRIQNGGRDGFYKGKTSELLVRYMKENGGLISQRDLDEYTAVERKPIVGSYHGYQIYSMPPPSSGGVALCEMLNILEKYNLLMISKSKPIYFHLLTEVMRRAYYDRALYLGDPEFNESIPLEKLNSKKYAASLGESISFSKSSKSPEINSFKTEGNSTTHISVLDKEGNAVSLTYTLEQSFGSGIIADGLGFILNNEMGDFNAKPGVTDSTGTIGTTPNQIEPGKRMLSSMTPTIVAKDNKVNLVIGSPGGRTIINTVLQVIINIIDLEMSLENAINSGRIHHQMYPDLTRFEKNEFDSDLLNAYKKLGHKLQLRSTQGRAMGILVDHLNKKIYGTSDKRSIDGSAEGY